MSFLLPCPNCGRRSVYEFRFGGEETQNLGRNDAEDDPYRFNRVNAADVQTEWWFHRFGCRQWLRVVRNTVSNEVLESFLPQGEK